MAKLSCFSIISCIPIAPDGVNGSTAISLNPIEAFNLYYKLQSWKIESAHYTANVGCDSPYGRKDYSISCNPAVNQIYDRSNGGLIDERSLACNLPIGSITLTDNTTNYQMAVGLEPNWYRKGAGYIYIPPIGSVVQLSPDNFPLITFSVATAFDGVESSQEHYIAYQVEEGVWINYANFTKQIGFVYCINKVIPLFASFRVQFEASGPDGLPINPTFNGDGTAVIQNLSEWQYQA